MQWRLGFVAVLLAFTVSTPAAASFASGVGIMDDDCAMCHDGSEADVPSVGAPELENSVHDGLECVDCHLDIGDLPHEDALAPAACASCHEQLGTEYVGHGRGTVGVTPDLPGCADCHGTHDIRPISDPESRVSVQHLGETCGRCHDDLDLAKEHDIMLKRPGQSYEASVHGEASKAGRPAPNCTHCHGTDGTAHHILPPHDPKSSISHFNIPETCGQCHSEIEKEYRLGIHGILMERGDVHSPVCTDCHGEHGILPVGDPRSNVSPVLVAQSTCVPCHESARITESYGVSDKERHFVDTYHGLKSKSGDRSVANCASCHGAHAILPSSNPASSIHASNLKATCGKCHPAITTEFAQTSIHAELDDADHFWPHLIGKIYLWLIAVVIGGMLLFVLSDYLRGMKDLMGKVQVRRMDTNAVIQHTLLMVSFIVLVYTGFALRYSGGWLFHNVFSWDGGAHTRGLIHRVAGCVFLFSVFWHAIYLVGHKGRQFAMGMLPGRRDVIEFIQAVQYNLRRRPESPRYGRFSFVEKAEYWALVWGTAVMVITGLLLWFDDIALKIFPKVVLDVFRIIHLYEAWLATLAIAVWHFYSTILKPGVYPGNPAWLTGKMPKTMYEHEHPGDLDMPPEEK